MRLHKPTWQEILDVWRDGLHDILAQQTFLSHVIIWAVIIVALVCVAQWASTKGTDLDAPWED